MTSYVHDNLEVKLTGRQAKRESGDKSGRRGRTPQRIDILYEIEPADKEDGSWKKWVRMSDLYEIVDESTDDGGPSEESVSSGEERGDVNWPDGE